MNVIRREPAVSGLFYPNDARELINVIESSFKDNVFGPGHLPPSSSNFKIYGIVSPHAGYIYSGAIAANGFYEISSSQFDAAIIIGPNHYGLGSDIALMERGEWISPLGETPIDNEISQLLYNESKILNFDSFAHSRDHCIEVQLPFIQYINKGCTIVPIILGRQDEEISNRIGKCIYDVSKLASKKIMLIASSDLTHYLPNNIAHEKDKELISSILSLDVSKFYSTLERYAVNACGYGAIGTIMKATKELGATKGKLLKYATSGDVLGDRSSVVGYSSIIFI